MNVRPIHHQRPLAAVALAYGAGVWMGVRFSWLPGWSAAGLALAAGLCFLMRRAGRRMTLGLMSAALFCGMLLGGAAAHPALPEPGKYAVRGVMAGALTLREDGSAAGYLERVTVISAGEETRLGKVYWTYTPDPDAPFLPEDGQEISFQGKLYHPTGQVNPYGFDFRLFLLQKGAAVGISGATDACVMGEPGRGLRSLFYRARCWLSERARAIFGADSALPEALLLGVREQLPEETRESFSDAGVAHLLSVSGLHVALLAGVVLIPLRALLSPKKCLLGIGAFLLIYCALLDFSAPVVRASILMLMAQARRIVRRAEDRPTALAAAFLLILLVRPLDLFSVSFQLSFCAVLGMVLFQPGLQKRLGFLPVPFLRDGLAVTISATAGSILPTIQVFHQFSLVGLVVNPFLCAVFGVLLPAYAFVLLVGCVFLPAGQMLAVPLCYATKAVTAAVEWLGELPLAAVRVPSLPWYLIVALVLSGLLITRYSLMPRGKKAAIACAALAVSLGIGHFTACRDVTYLQFAMGQADAALIADREQTILIDVGEYGGDVADYLLSTGRRADRVILTHLHVDHCLGLTELLEEEIPIGAVYLPEGAEEMAVDAACLKLLDRLRDQEIPIFHLHAGDTLQTARTTLRVLWPYPGGARPHQNANRYSLAMLCDLDGVALLTASDVEGLYEGYIAQDADVLKVAHHGSKNSTGEEFLRAVSPTAAFVTGGNGALPHPDTLARLAQAGVWVYNTQASGAVTLTVRSGQGILVPYLAAEEQP